MAICQQNCRTSAHYRLTQINIKGYRTVVVQSLINRSSFVKGGAKLCQFCELVQTTLHQYLLNARQLKVSSLLGVDVKRLGSKVRVHNFLDVGGDDVCNVMNACMCK